jgi:hypothetical protein
VEYVEKNSWKLITICCSKIMFIIICCAKQITLWGGGAMVKNLSPQCGGEEFKSPLATLGYLGYLSDLIR